MTDILAWVLALPVAYLIGAVPTGYLIGKVWRGVDVRKYGSGGTGFTNVMRTLGKTAAVTVLAVDIGKGVLPVFLTGLFTDVEVIVAVSATMAVVGHMYPVYTKFNGGRGVATAFGALLMLSPIAAGAAAVGLLVVVITRYVSAGSLVGTAVASVTLVVLILVGHHGMGYLAFAIPILFLIPVRHVGNILRLLKGTENQFQLRARPRRRAKARQSERVG
jgi:glycerol-3-phosphate acyltransferase PlsY